MVMAGYMRGFVVILGEDFVDRAGGGRRGAAVMVLLRLLRRTMVGMLTMVMLVALML